MGDNIANIELPVAEWVDLYTLSGIDVGLPLMVENNGSPDVYLCVQSAQPAVDHDSYNVVQRGNGVRLQNAPGSAGAWAFCNTAGGKVAVGIAQQDGFFDPVGDGSAPSINPDNSSSISLDIGGTFTGAWIDTTGIGIAYVSVYSDVASAIDGLIIEQSTDGVNADHSDEYSIPAAHGKNFAVNPHAHFLRVRYVNGSIAQTVFRLQTKLNRNGLASSHRIKDDITTDDDARLVKSILAIKANAEDQYKNIELANPMPVNTGQLYQSDINLEHSDMGTFSGTPIDLVDDRWSPITDTTANNPKVITIEFERALQTSIIGITTETGSFSNTVIKYGLTTFPDQTLVDESADATLKTTLVAPSVPITLTRIVLEFHTVNTITLTHLDMSKDEGVIAQIQGVDPDGELLTVGTSRNGNLNVGIQEYGDTSAVDAFARLRISEPFTIFDSKQLYDKQPIFWDEIVGGSATSVHSTVNAATVMTVTANAGDYVIRQTKQRFNYQPGKSSLIAFTMHCEQQTGVTKRVGAFDGTGVTYETPYNGIFFEVTGTSISWNIAKNGSTTETATQANWNYDPMDGTGPSGLTLDLDGVIIGFFDYEWLGVGRVRCGFYISGVPRYTHFFTHSNDPAFVSVYTSTPNLPLRYYISSDGTGAGTLDHICSTVMSEGGLEQTGIARSIDTLNVHLDANAADQPYVLLALRLKSTHLDLTVLPQSLTMISETNDDFKFFLSINPTYAGTLTYIDIANSGCQRAAGVTANTISDYGLLLYSGYAKSSGSLGQNIVSSLRIGSQIDGTRDELILGVVPLGSNSDIQGSLIFRELL